MQFRQFYDSEYPASDVLQAAQDVMYGPGPEHGDPLDRLSHEARLVHQLLGLSAQINNGGFDQFFFNSEGGYCEEMHAFLLEIGADDCARILRSAMTHFPGGHVPTDDEERAEALTTITQDIAVSDAFSGLDKEFWKHDTALCAKLDEFVRANPDAKVQKRDESLN